MVLWRPRLEKEDKEVIKLLGCLLGDVIKVLEVFGCLLRSKNGPKKYSELSATEALQADCDIKETNIILQGLPPEVYALVSNHNVAKEL
ncbi:hypothetical protein Tco_1572189 [Tanacetum coccineum]